MYNLIMSKKDKIFEEEFIKDFINKLEAINEPVFRVSKDRFPYRVINSWDNENILIGLDNNRDNKWRYFSLLGLVWLEIVRQLRVVGIGIEKIKLNKKLIEFKSGPDLITKTNFSILEMLLIRYFSEGKTNTYLVFDETYLSNFYFDIEGSKLDLSNSDFKIIINLDRIFKNIKNDAEDQDWLGETLISVDKENDTKDRLKEISEKVNSSDNFLKEVRLKIKNKNIDKIDYKMGKNNPDNALADIRLMLNQTGRQEITIKQENGKIVCVERIEKS